MKIQMTSYFSRHAKKFHANQKEALKEAIQKVIDEPDIEEMKIGDLAGIRVYKFRMVNQLMLMAYTILEAKEKTLILLSIDTHENFYEKLKNQGSSK